MRTPSALVVAAIATASLSGSTRAPRSPATALGIDVDFYTGPISSEIWKRMRSAGQRFAIAQAWGGRSRNEHASAQLAGARSAGMHTAAYVLLNYDDQVCPSYANPVRASGGSCVGDAIRQPQPGGRWQVRQGVAALGPEFASVAFIAIDVEWFLSGGPASDELAQAERRATILEALDEVVAWHKRPVIYTRNGRWHWLDITGCPAATNQPDCERLHAVVRNARRPVPLWDVEKGDAQLDGFQPHGAWTARVGRQYQLDQNLFGLPPGKTVDLNIFDESMFAQPRASRR